MAFPSYHYLGIKSKLLVLAKGAHEEWKSKILKDALEELEKAMNYVMDVPVHITGYEQHV